MQNSTECLMELVLDVVSLHSRHDQRGNQPCISWHSHQMLKLANGSHGTYSCTTQSLSEELGPQRMLTGASSFVFGL